jgi:hypothetical protein
VLVVLKRDETDDELTDLEEQAMKNEELDSGTIILQPTSQDKKEQLRIEVDDGIVLPAGIENLPVKIERKPGEFIPVEDPGIVPPEFEAIDSDDEFTLGSWDAAPVGAPNKVTKKTPEIMRSQEEQQTGNILNKINDIDKNKEPDEKNINNETSEDPLKDLYD